LPSNLDSPPEAELIAGLESRRLDLLGLKQGYDSQDASLRTAILAQFPKISLGFNRAGDTSNVQTLGFGVTVDIPIFDRNQGNIATERATRQKLFDEYADRLFQARSDVATALSDIRHLNRQIAAGEKLVPTLQRLVDTARSALDQGNADVISYYQTRFNLILRQIEVLKLKQQLVETHIALEIASGRYRRFQNAMNTRRRNVVILCFVAAAVVAAWLLTRERQAPSEETPNGRSQLPPLKPHRSA
jgi:outer membrane protein TolC